MAAVRRAGHRAAGPGLGTQLRGGLAARRRRSGADPRTGHRRRRAGSGAGAWLVPARGAGRRLGAPDPVAVRPHPDFGAALDRAQLAPRRPRRAGPGARRRARRDSYRTRSGPGVRHRQPSHHPFVPGLAGSRAARRRACWTTAAARAFWPLPRASWARARPWRWTSIRRPCSPPSTMPRSTRYACRPCCPMRCRPASSRSWWRTSSPIRSRCWRPCWPGALRRAAIWCSRACSSARPTKWPRPMRPG
ncbi:Uncharacterised protein [Bordetella pertussis]|nr:Uncharacterised protein [Bordetella pertussis]